MHRVDWSVDRLVLHTSDLGLKNWTWGGVCSKTGLNKGFLDAYNSFKYIVDAAIDKRVKYVIIAGDINEERNPEALLIEKFCIQIRRLMAHYIKVIIVAGNHDLDGSIGSSTSISYLKALNLENIFISDLKDETFEFGDVVFHCLPYYTKHQLGFDKISDLQEYVNDWLEKKSIKKYYDKEGREIRKILISHYAVTTSFDGNEIEEIRLPFELMSRWDYVALGHIHQWEEFSSKGVNGGFCGSPYIKNFGENVDKFYNLVNLGQFNNEDKLHYDAIEIPSRSFVDIDLDAIDSELSDVLDILENNFKGRLKDTMVKVRIKTYQRFNPKPIYDFLRQQEVFHYLPIHWNLIQSTNKAQMTIDNMMQDSEIIETYLKKCKLDETWYNRIMNIHKEIEDDIK